MPEHPVFAKAYTEYSSMILVCRVNQPQLLTVGAFYQSAFALAASAIPPHF